MLEDVGGKLRLGANANDMNIPARSQRGNAAPKGRLCSLDLLNQLVFRERRFDRLDLVALFFEHSLPDLVDILE